LLQSEIPQPQALSARRRQRAGVPGGGRWRVGCGVARRACGHSSFGAL